ncbi:TPR Domain containing protein [Fusarium tjaetaba]|uniref:TPR Domain containing protein n=1 Tax=Fusarium tjaetaba TaxID=1567544 RepID=A0A8H5QL95_9HYPO|nr:TPR Domain containing protein [Fusarium tjaetaba]KAF5617319.1 TPR Domain containing protein [Fusarium tjaetaba]
MTVSGSSDEASQLDQQIALLMSYEPEDANEHVFIGQQYATVAEGFLDLWQSSSDETYLEKARRALAKGIELVRSGAEMLPSSGEEGEEMEFWALAAQMATSMFQSFSDSTALDQAISYYMRALEAANDEGEIHGAVLLNLANCLIERAEREDSAENASRDINRAIQNGQSAIAALGRNPICLSDVSTMFLTRFEKRGDFNDLDEATKLSKEAMDNTSPEDTSISSRQSNFAQCLRYQFQRTGGLDYLHQAIELLTKAKESSSSATAPTRAKILGNLSMALNLRYESLGTNSDLLDAIRISSAALQIDGLETEGLVYPVILSNLASYHQSYHQAFPDNNSIDSAISLAELAVEALKDNPMRWGRCLYNLATMLDEKSKTTSGLSETARDELVERSIGYLEQSTAAQNLDQSLLAMQNDFWSRLLHEKYQRLGSQNQDLLDTAISKAAAAVQASSELQDNRGDFLVQLADLHQSKFEKSGIEQSFDAALQALEECSNMKAARTLTRITSCHRAALLCASKKQFVKAARFAGIGVNMMPNLVYCALEKDSQLQALQNTSGLSNLAAALALEAGATPGEAMELLEAGRGIVAKRSTDFAQGLDSSKLDDRGRQLLETYRQLKRRIEAPMSGDFLGDEYPSTLTDSTSRRLEDASSAANIEERLKTNYGFDVNPQLTENCIIGIASTSPIVAFVLTEFRSSALIATGSGIQVLDLPDLKLHECTEYYATMQMPVEDALHSLKFNNFFEINENLKRLLIWLWDVAVLPVLRHLGCYTPEAPLPTTQLARIHWLTSNIMGLMPLHAAGHHDDDSTNNAISHVMSSYTTTILSLRHSIRVMENLTLSKPLSQSKMAIIGMTKTPGPWPDFDKVPDHLKAVRQFITDESNTTYRENCTCSDALDALCASQMAHIVCHGISQRNPSNSSLILCRKEHSEPSGESEVVQDPLSVRQIASRGSRNSFLAYLAACQTADKIATGVLEENIHIVGAFQLLGYANTIGTLWEVEEKASVIFATEFYASLARRAQMCSQSNSHYPADMVATAFHDATIFLRLQDPEFVITWGPMVHFGP